MLSWNAVTDPEATIVYGVAHDITNLTETKERLERSEDLLRRAGALARVGGWEYDTESKSLVWNEETRRIHEVPADDLPRFDAWLMFFDAQSRSSVAAALRTCLSEGTPFDSEASLLTARGHQVWVRIQGQRERAIGPSARPFARCRT